MNVCLFLFSHQNILQPFLFSLFWCLSLVGQWAAYVVQMSTDWRVVTHPHAHTYSGNTHIDSGKKEPVIKSMSHWLAAKRNVLRRTLIHFKLQQYWKPVTTAKYWYGVISQLWWRTLAEWSEGRNQGRGGWAGGVRSGLRWRGHRTGIILLAGRGWDYTWINWDRAVAVRRAVMWSHPSTFFSLCFTPQSLPPSLFQSMYMWMRDKIWLHFQCKPCACSAPKSITTPPSGISVFSLLLLCSYIFRCMTSH